MRVDRPTGRGARPARRLFATVLAVIGLIAVVPATGLAQTTPEFDGWATAVVDGDETVALGGMSSVVDQIGARNLWQQGITGEGVTVAVIDTGVAPVPDLSGANKVIAMVDLSDEATMDEARFLDTYGHGTHMTGIIAGRSPGADPSTATSDSTDFFGVAPDAEIVSVKVANNTGAVDVSQVIAGIDWVIEHKDELDIDVLNLSYGTNAVQHYEIDPLAFAVEQAWQAGIVVVVAAGNDGRGTKRLGNPASDPFVIAVAAAEPRLNGNWKVPSWGTSGDGVRNPDVSAPGVSIESLRAPGSRIDVEHPEGYASVTRFRGTGSSQAAAVVSGAAALLLSARPELTPDEVKALLIKTADPVGSGQERFGGSGLIDLDEAATANVPAGATQTWPRSDGSGSLEAARGDAHVVIDGVDLVGEVTVLGVEWDANANANANVDRWTDGTWDGRTWGAAAWRGTTWAAAQWTGRSWRGEAWNGALWTSSAWTTGVWNGADWTAATWRGRSWRETGWDGRSWREAEWLGRSWRWGVWS